MKVLRHLSLLPALLAALLAGGGPLLANDNEASADENYERQFVLSNVEFTLRHEIAHVLAWELKPPVFGREEDIADIFAVVGYMQMPMRKEEEGIVEQLQKVADGWKLEWQLALEEKSELAYWDLHSLDIQRYYNIVCLVYGADPINNAGLLKTAGLPIDRAEWCHEEYEQARHAIEWMRSHFAATAATAPGATRGKIIVNYEQNNEVEGEKLDHWLREARIADRLAEMVSERIALPRDITISFENCPFPNAVWIKEKAKVQFCHPLLSRFLYLARELRKMPAAPAGSTARQSEAEGRREGDSRRPALSSP